MTNKDGGVRRREGREGGGGSGQNQEEREKRDLCKQTWKSSRLLHFLQSHWPV